MVVDEEHGLESLGTHLDHPVLLLEESIAILSLDGLSKVSSAFLRNSRFAHCYDGRGYTSTKWCTDCSDTHYQGFWLALLCRFQRKLSMGL